MTGRPVRYPRRHREWEAIPAILARIRAATLPAQRGICGECRALIDTLRPCPICSELRRRAMARMRGAR